MKLTKVLLITWIETWSPDYEANAKFKMSKISWQKGIFLKIYLCDGISGSGLATDRYHFFETDANIRSQISVERYDWASLIIVKFELAYRPVLKRSKISRYISRSLLWIICRTSTRCNKMNYLNIIKCRYSFIWKRYFDQETAKWPFRSSSQAATCYY